MCVCAVCVVGTYERRKSSRLRPSFGGGVAATYELTLRVLLGWRNRAAGTEEDRGLGPRT